MESDINPWVRADMHIYSPETFELVPDALKPDYVRIMSNLVITGAALSEAQQDYRDALEERHRFFEWVTHE